MPSLKHFDPHEYWKRRLQTADLRAVGLKSFSDAANQRIYESVKIAFQKALRDLNIPPVARIVDAGSGIGLFDYFLYERGYHAITAVDISPDALAAIKLPIVKKESALENLSQALPATYNIVFCFDVLYHIVDDQCFEKTLSSFADISDNYILLHGKYPPTPSPRWITHMRLRTIRQHSKILERCGFKLVRQYPTHALLLRTPWYKLYGIFPGIFAPFDDLLTRVLSAAGMTGLASHKILVYQRVSRT